MNFDSLKAFARKMAQFGGFVIVLAILSPDSSAKEKYGKAGLSEDPLLSLIDFKTFHFTIDEADGTVSRYCRVVSDNRYRNSSSRGYSCNSSTNATGFTISTTEYSGRTYVFVLDIMFPLENYHELKRILRQRFGRPDRSHEDGLGWLYNKDKTLTRYGQPIIDVHRDSEQKIAVVSIGIETGP